MHALLIGGPADGQRLNVRVVVKYLSVAVKPVKDQPPHSIYRRLRLGPDIEPMVALYIYNSMSDTAGIETLIQYYLSQGGNPT